MTYTHTYNPYCRRKAAAIRHPCKQQRLQARFGCSVRQVCDRVSKEQRLPMVTPPCTYARARPPPSLLRTHTHTHPHEKGGHGVKTSHFLCIYTSDSENIQAWVTSIVVSRCLQQRSCSYFCNPPPRRPSTSNTVRLCDRGCHMQVVEDKCSFRPALPLERKGAAWAQTVVGNNSRREDTDRTSPTCSFLFPWEFGQKARMSAATRERNPPSPAQKQQRQRQLVHLAPVIVFEVSCAFWQREK